MNATDNAIWNAVKRILCIRLDTIGDVIMTTPAMRFLQESQPDRHLTLMTSEAGAAIVPLVPDLDDLIVYDAPWLKATAPRQNSTPEFEMIEQLRQRQFDAAVIFTVYSQNPLPSAFLCYMAGIPLRLAHCRENPYQLLTHWVKEVEPDQITRHEVQRQLDLVKSIGADVSPIWPASAPDEVPDYSQVKDSERMRLQVSTATLERMKRILKEMGLGARDRPWVVIHPGATAASRRYPPESFAIAARQLAVDHGISVVFTGTAPEAPLVESIQQMMGVPSHSLVARLDLAELVALLKLVPLLISNNTGPVHIAAAVGTPVVDLYALTNLQHIPWGVPNRVLFHDVPCRLCYKSICPQEHHHCLRLVPPDAVVAAAIELLKERQFIRSESLAEQVRS